MFIMNTRSTMAVMSNSGGSGSSRRAMSWSAPDSPRLKLEDSMALARLGSSLEEVEDPHQAGAECVLQDANPSGEAGQHEIERNSSAEAHRRADEGDADLASDL